MMNRRKFLSNLAWVAGGMLATKLRPLESLLGLAKPIRIRGRVLALGKGLKDVVVSDGYTVTATNADGAYEMELHPSAAAVFVSVPSGYAFLHENNIARHYHLVKDIASRKRVDFSLQPLEQDDNRHRFIIWADPQVKNKSDVEKMLAQSVPDMQQHVQQLGGLIHGITVGDIVWDNHDRFEDYKDAVRKMNIPFFQALGNHDMDYRQGDDSVSDKTFKSHFGPTYYSFNRGKVHYVVLDDVRYLGREREYDGFITENQLEWLKKDLAFVPKDHLVIVCLHIPVHNGVSNRDELYEILKPYKAHIMSGHTHTNLNLIKKGVYEHVHGTVCGAWWTGPICGDGTPPGYGVYEVNGTDLTWYYKPVGNEQNFQSTIFIQRNETGAQELVANVWNYDPSWKVEWETDGQLQGALSATEGYDPLAVVLYKGDQLPAGRPFVEPKKTKHLFKTIIPEGVQAVKVKVTDRFGRLYETEARVNA